MVKKVRWGLNEQEQRVILAMRGDEMGECLLCCGSYPKSSMWFHDGSDSPDDGPVCYGCCERMIRHGLVEFVERGAQ